MVLLTVLAYNEEEALEGTIEAMLGAKRRSSLIKEVLVVNDGSKDQTQKIVDRFGSEVTSISHQRNYGKTAGFGSALDYGKALKHEAIQLLDADMINLQPEQILALTDEFNLDPSISMAVSPYSQGTQTCPTHLSGYRIIHTSKFVQKTKGGWKLPNNRSFPLFELPGYGLETALTKAFGDQEKVVHIDGLASRERCATFDPRKMLYELLETGGILDRYGF